jgi:alkanesulfonate monooxygenase SsuD/methylene tetrahydromethanopterin reductase-like flavin-dependent oxidoreductase (luciferase family)
MGRQAVMNAYRERYRPSPREPRPQAMLTVFAVCAPTDAEADRLAGAIDLRRLQMARGFDAPVATTEQALGMEYGTRIARSSCASGPAPSWVPPHACGTASSPSPRHSAPTR